MKKIGLLLLGCLCVGACATWHVQPCGQKLVRPYFFEQGEQLAAFYMQADLRGQRLEGVLQIKKQDEKTYLVDLFSAAGGYRIFQVELTRQNAQYLFMMPAADRAVVRSKTTQFLQLLLFPAQTEVGCRTTLDAHYVYYKQPSMRYVYAPEQIYPNEVQKQKTFGHVHLNFAEYELYEDGQLPQQLHYQDGSVQLTLTLLRLKK